MASAGSSTFLRSVAELRLAALATRARRFLEVLRREAHEELRVALELDRRLQAASLETRPQHALRELHALCAPAVDLLGERERLVHPLRVGNDARYEPDALGLLRGDVAAGEADLEGARAADRVRQQEGEAELGRGEAVLDACRAEVGRLGGEADVAAERQAEPAADGRPVHRTDDRLR